ncbi:putative ADP-ribosylation factor-binding protein C25H2.16c [Dissostichus eleginoides]|uniref:ADP-ribosylation factor-binding protein C25H2.16c n=1 Tax=Dissostichus eleginoides TaxID=100907 RepID=A0AAD9CKV5_DISEL|nr:putative ADP-ribosylation factor-binding protein C25H2.16c [Dissostichus eleginoides]
MKPAGSAPAVPAPGCRIPTSYFVFPLLRLLNTADPPADLKALTINHAARSGGERAGEQVTLTHPPPDPITPQTPATVRQ